MYQSIIINSNSASQHHVNQSNFIKKRAVSYGNVSSFPQSVILSSNDTTFRMPSAHGESNNFNNKVDNSQHSDIFKNSNGSNFYQPT
jgi:hypothetical protein